MKRKDRKAMISLVGKLIVMEGSNSAHACIYTYICFIQQAQTHAHTPNHAKIKTHILYIPSYTHPHQAHEAESVTS